MKKALGIIDTENETEAKGKNIQILKDYVDSSGEINTNANDNINDVETKLTNMILKISALESQLKEKNDQNSELSNQLSELQKNCKKQEKEFKESIEQKDSEIEALENQIVNSYQVQDNRVSNSDFQSLYNQIKSELIVVNIQSDDKKVNFSTAALKNTNFMEIEKKFYDEYPNYQINENSFLLNGNPINKFSTLEDNQIKNGNILIIKSIGD